MEIRPWDKQRRIVFLDRYALKDNLGRPVEQEPEQMWQRVARVFANNERERNSFLSAMRGFKFIPGGRVLAGAGTNTLMAYYNCFLVPIECSDSKKGNDSRQGIMETMANVIEINCRGGGVGINWSTLRPKGSYVQGVHGHSSGVIGWSRAMSALVRQVEQGGSREAALIFLLEDWHPDIIEFIRMKRDLDTVRNANVSIGVSDAFMEAVRTNSEWKLVFPETSHPEYNRFWTGDLRGWLDRGLPVRVYQTIKARQLWDLICESAWCSGEPGVVFLDRCQTMSNTWYTERIRGVNVCGEQPLPDWGVCNLGAINLVAHMDKNGNVQDAQLARTIHTAVAFLDNVIDKNLYLNEKMKERQLRIRRIGLGTMGLADALLLAGIRYGSPESVTWVDRVYAKIRNTAYWASVKLAEERGPAPAFDPDKYLQGPFIRRLPENLQEAIRNRGIRNLSLLTQAPTGTTSILAGVSSGIEPVFSWTYVRKDKTGEYLIEHPLYAKYEKNLPDYFVTAYDLTPQEHVTVQAAVQKYVDSSISKTVNAPNNHTLQEVKELFELAYEQGCKGITYYRDGSREGVLQKVEKERFNKGICPSCNMNSIIYEEGCIRCKNCGYSACYLS